MVRFLHIKVNGIELMHNNGIQQSYYAIVYNQKHYFTSVFDHENYHLDDDIIIQLKDNQLPQIINLQRWENCIILFDFQMDITEIKTRGFIKKKIEGRKNQIINLLIHVYEGKDLLFTDHYLENVSQHYLIIEDVYDQRDNVSRGAFNSLNYFSIHTKNHEYVLPLRGSTVIVKVPDSLQIKHFANNIYNGCSEVIQHTKIKNNMQIQINKDNKTTAKVILKIKWAINLHRFQVDQNMLLDSNQILLYDFEFKFDLITQIQGCRFKILHGSKAFQFTDDIDQNKITKIKRIIYFIVKSQKQEIDIVLTKNGKLFVSCRLNTFEITQNNLNIIKKKFIDVHNPNKVYGFIKLRAERGKNVSIPQSNRLWRQVLKRKQTPTAMMIAIQQPTCYYNNNQKLVLVGKVQNQQKVINLIPNINFFNGQDDINKQIIQFNLKGQDIVYLMIKNDVKNKDFIGIGVINTTQLKLGINACEVGFFKNQEQTGTINCIINKMIFWPFIKHVFQNQILNPVPINQNIDIFINKITLSSYFYTYSYDNKKQLYCIIQLNKVKKVLILQSNQHDDLNFNAVEGSDQLNYIVEQPDFIKIKITFLVSDLGHEEQIYGIAICNCRSIELEKGHIHFKNIEISNDYSVHLGFISLEVIKGSTPQPPPPKVKTHIQKEKKNILAFDILSQDSFQSQFISHSSKIKGSPSRRYSGGYIIGETSKPSPQDFLKKGTKTNPVKDIKLPMIKEKKKSVDQIFFKLKMRKRGLGGAFLGETNTPKQSQIRRHMQSFDLKKIQQSNPNISRNLQILFPHKGNQRQIQSYRSRKNDYEDKLKGLKSVMHEMGDIGQVQPSIRQTHNDDDYQYENIEQLQQQYTPLPNDKRNDNSKHKIYQKQSNDVYNHSQQLYKPIYESQQPQYQANDGYQSKKAQWEGNQFAN